MKRILIAIMAGLMLSASVPAKAVSQNSHHSATTVVNATKGKTPSEATTQSKDTTTIVAFSDTTDTIAIADSLDKVTMSINSNSISGENVKDILRQTLMPVCAIAIIFFLAPVGILALIVYLIVKSRQQKIKLAELALKGGQPIPDDLLDNNPSTHNKKKLWEKGILKIFLGLGIVVMCVFLDSSLGMGIGFLVAFYGCGQFFIDYWGNRQKKKNDIVDTDVADQE